MGCRGRGLGRRLINHALRDGPDYTWTTSSQSPKTGAARTAGDTCPHIAGGDFLDGRYGLSGDRRGNPDRGCCPAGAMSEYALRVEGGRLKLVEMQWRTDGTVWVRRRPIAIRRAIRSRHEQEGVGAR